MRYILVLLLGAVLGGGTAVYFLGAPRAKTSPGVVVKAPDPKGDQPGTVVVSLDQGFVDAALATTFSGLGPPTFNLGKLDAGDQNRMTLANFQGGCSNTITLLPEGSGVKTGVQFLNGTISAPMVFTGSYSLLGNCMQFKGWAQTSIQLRFEEPKQTVYGNVTVESVNLEGVSPVASNFITVFVQTAINERVNPLILVTERQLSLMVPIKASNGSVRAHAKDVKAEILEGSLKLHVTYEFEGVKGEV